MANINWNDVWVVGYEESAFSFCGERIPCYWDAVTKRFFRLVPGGDVEAAIEAADDAEPFKHKCKSRQVTRLPEDLPANEKGEGQCVYICEDMLKGLGVTKPLVDGQIRWVELGKNWIGYGKRSAVKAALDEFAGFALGKMLDKLALVLVSERPRGAELQDVETLGKWAHFAVRDPIRRMCIYLCMAEGRSHSDRLDPWAVFDELVHPRAEYQEVTPEFFRWRLKCLREKLLIRTGMARQPDMTAKEKKLDGAIDAELAVIEKGAPNQVVSIAETILNLKKSGEEPEELARQFCEMYSFKPGSTEFARGCVARWEKTSSWDSPVNDPQEMMLFGAEPTTYSRTDVLIKIIKEKGGVTTVNVNHFRFSQSVRKFRTATLGNAVRTRPRG